MWNRKLIWTLVFTTQICFKFASGQQYGGDYQDYADDNINDLENGIDDYDNSLQLDEVPDQGYDYNNLGERDYNILDEREASATGLQGPAKELPDAKKDVGGSEVQKPVVSDSEKVQKPVGSDPEKVQKPVGSDPEKVQKPVGSDPEKPGEVDPRSFVGIKKSVEVGPGYTGYKETIGFGPFGEISFNIGGGLDGYGNASGDASGSASGGGGGSSSYPSAYLGGQIGFDIPDGDPPVKVTTTPQPDSFDLDHRAAIAEGNSITKEISAAEGKISAPEDKISAPDSKSPADQVKQPEAKVPAGDNVTGSVPGTEVSPGPVDGKAEVSGGLSVRSGESSPQTHPGGQKPSVPFYQVPGTNFQTYYSYFPPSSCGGSCGSSGAIVIWKPYPYIIKEGDPEEPQKPKDKPRNKHKK